MIINHTEENSINTERMEQEILNICLSDPRMGVILYHEALTSMYEIQSYRLDYHFGNLKQPPCDSSIAELSDSTHMLKGKYARCCSLASFNAKKVHRLVGDTVDIRFVDEFFRSSATYTSGWFRLSSVGKILENYDAWKKLPLERMRLEMYPIIIHTDSSILKKMASGSYLDEHAKILFETKEDIGWVVSLIMKALEDEKSEEWKLFYTKTPHPTYTHVPRIISMHVRGCLKCGNTAAVYTVDMEL